MSLHEPFAPSVAPGTVFHGQPFPASSGEPYLKAKRFFDLVAAVLALLAILPLTLGVIILLLIIQGRPVFVAQQRVGRGGRKFACLKFRTMEPNADVLLEHCLAADPALHKEWAECQKLRVDPRVTPLGRILRKSSVDELPQLLNIISGEMSLVGPRPIRDSEVDRYGVLIQKYYKVRPGLTGAWQVSGRNDLCYTDRVNLDTDYVDNISLQRDIGIMLRTIPAVLKSRGCY